MAHGPVKAGSPSRSGGRRELQIFGAANERSGEAWPQFGPLLAGQVVAAIFIERWIDEIVEELGVGAHPVERGVFENLRGDAFVEDVEIFGQAQQGRALAQNVVRQAVQRADAVADFGQQGFLAALQESRECGAQSYRRRCWRR